jgi:hypothetical protein
MLQSGTKQMVCTHVCLIFSSEYMAEFKYSLQYEGGIMVNQFFWESHSAL